MNEQKNNETPPGELNPGFKFRLIMTIILFVMAVVYITWLLKLI
jgi:hypothetical protein